MSGEYVDEGMEGLTPFVVQCDQDGQMRTWPRPVWHPTLCGFCAKPVDLSDCICFVSDSEQCIGYPYDDSRAFLFHADCGPGVGYTIDLMSLAGEDKDGDYSLSSASGWRTHLMSKDWYHSGIDYALEAAHNLAVRLRAELRARLAAPVPKSAPAPALPRVRMVDPTRNPRSISLRLRTRVMERDDFRCRRCGCGPSDERLVVDHIIPVSKGGTADESNLQTLCNPCNSGKSDRDPHAHDLGGSV